MRNLRVGSIILLILLNINQGLPVKEDDELKAMIEKLIAEPARSKTKSSN